MHSISCLAHALRSFSNIKFAILIHLIYLMSVSPTNYRWLVKTRSSMFWRAEKLAADFMMSLFFKLCRRDEASDLIKRNNLLVINSSFSSGRFRNDNEARKWPIIRNITLRFGIVFRTWKVLKLIQIWCFFHIPRGEIFAS